MVGKILEPEIRGLIEARNFAALREVFREWPPADVAEVILDLPEDEQVIIFRVLPHDLAADVFEYLDFDAQEQLLRAMAHEQVVGILNEMAPDDRTALLEELPSAAARQLIRLLTPEERRVATALLGYPEDSVGRLMTPDFIAVHEDWTVQQVLDYVREHGRDSETLNFVYVVDDRGKLIDDVRMREFLLRPLTTKVSDIRDQTFGALNVTDSQQDALNVFRKYDRAALPVVDSNGVVVGIVTADDMLDVAEEEATEDIQKFGGMEALDEPYMRIPLWRMVRKRAGWLIVLFLGEMLTATAMASYQEELAKALVLALFLPLIVSSGGNSGSQASTLMIRAMALGEVTSARLVASDESRSAGRSFVRRNPGSHRRCSRSDMGSHWRTVSASTTVRSALATRRSHRRNFARRCRNLGNAFRFHASLSSTQNRSRPGDIVCAVRSNAGRCDRIDYLFQHRVSDHARRDAIGVARCSVRCPQRMSLLSSTKRRYRLLGQLLNYFLHAANH